MSKFTKPKILFLDLETLPMEGYMFQMFEVNFALNMIKQHTTIACWAAKWQGKAHIFYDEVDWQKNIRDDKKICKAFQDLINEADIIVGHAIDRFDKKKSNYRFIVNKFQPTTQCRVIDTLKIAKKHFAFDSNKLEHLADILGVEYKKYKHTKFSGFDLWRACLEKNPEAWAEMKKYNIRDVQVLEAVYEALIPWDNTININVYHKDHANICSCGSVEFFHNGFDYQKFGKFERFKCRSCGKNLTSKQNELSLEKRKKMLK